MRDYIREYYEQIRSGKITTSLKVQKVYKQLVYDLDHPGEYYYDERRAEIALRFIMRFCRQSKGQHAGEPIDLMLWQRAFLCAVYGFIDCDGYRQYRDVFLVVGRKNGKTTLSSGIGNNQLFADGENGPEVYSAATTRDQAKLSWEEAKKMIRKSPALNSRARPLVSEILTDFNDGKFKPLSSDYGTLDGLNPSAAIMDEVAAWTNGQALYDVIVDGESARTQPLNIMISTAGTVREDIYDTLYERAERKIATFTNSDPDVYRDEHFLPIIYELDNRSEWTDENCWIKANPGLDVIKNRENLADKVRRAQTNPMLVKNLLCKDFNIRETSSEAWLTFEELNNEDTFTLNRAENELIWTPAGEKPRLLPYPKYGIGGCDLSSTTDLTAAKVIFVVPGCSKLFALSMYWIAEELVEKKVNEDKIPYDKWIDRGLVRTTPGNSVHYRYVKEWFQEVQEEMDIYIPWIGYDSWSAKYFVEDMTGYFGINSMLPVIQGKKTLSDPMKRLHNEIGSHNVIYNNNPIDKWCLANTAYEEDKNGNIQPHKTGKSTRRIDGTAALLDAFTVYLNKQDEFRNMCEV